MSQNTLKVHEKKFILRVAHCVEMLPLAVA